jgi:hypothetical protein
MLVNLCLDFNQQTIVIMYVSICNLRLIKIKMILRIV